MFFYVKYIGGCEDISQLLKMSQQEAGSGNKVVLVCDKISYQQYVLPDIPVFYNPEDVKTADSGIVFVCCEPRRHSYLRVLQAYGCSPQPRYRYGLYS